MANFIVRTAQADAELDTGVYCICNTVNGKRYVGSAAQSFRKRWWEHRSRLRQGRHSNLHLQRAWDKYGEDAFEFTILERCLSSDCLSREQCWLDRYKSADGRLGYNASPTAGSRLGMTNSEQHRARISAANKGRKPSPEAIAKTAAKLRGRRGRKHTADTIARISAAHKGKVISDEQRARIAATLAGRVQSEEAKAKRSASLKAAYASGRRKPTEFTAEVRAKIAVANRARSPESRERHATLLRGRKQSEEANAKRSASLRIAWAKRKAAQAIVEEPSE